MADEEKKSGGLIKYLLIGIGVLSIMILSSVVSIYTYKTMMDKKEAAAENPETTVKDKIDFEEFSIYPLDPKEKGTTKFKFTAEVNDTKVKNYLTTKKATVRDNITRKMMLFKIQDLKQAYQSCELHTAIKKELNDIIGDNIKEESSLLGLGVKKKFLAVNVSIYDFTTIIPE